jgi:hypothetical protein
MNNNNNNNNNNDDVVVLHKNPLRRIRVWCADSRDARHSGQASQQQNTRYWVDKAFHRDRLREGAKHVPLTS